MTASVVVVVVDNAGDVAAVVVEDISAAGLVGDAVVVVSGIKVELLLFSAVVVPSATVRLDDPSTGTTGALDGVTVTSSTGTLLLKPAVVIAAVS